MGVDRKMIQEWSSHKPLFLSFVVLPTIYNLAIHQIRYHIHQINYTMRNMYRHSSYTPTTPLGHLEGRYENNTEPQQVLFLSRTNMNVKNIRISDLRIALKHDMMKWFFPFSLSLPWNKYYECPLSTVSLLPFLPSIHHTLIFFLTGYIEYLPFVLPSTHPLT